MKAIEYFWGMGYITVVLFAIVQNGAFQNDLIDFFRIPGFYIIFGIGCGIAFGNTMTIGNLRLPVQQKVYGNTSFNTLMQFAGAVGTSVCAALVASVQNQNSGVSYEMKTASGSTHSFIFLLILAVICLALQITGFKVYETKEKQD